METTTAIWASINGFITSHCGAIAIFALILFALQIFSVVILMRITTELIKWREQWRDNHIHIKNAYEVGLRDKFFCIFGLLIKKLRDASYSIRTPNESINLGIKLGEIISLKTDLLNSRENFVDSCHPKTILSLLRDLYEKGSPTKEKIGEIIWIVTNHPNIGYPSPRDKIADLFRYEKLTKGRISDLEKIIDFIADMRETKESSGNKEPDEEELPPIIDASSCCGDPDCECGDSHH